MELPKHVRLTRCSTNREELATFERLDREDAKNLIQSIWWTDLASTLRDPADEPDRHWDWRQLVSHYRNKPYFNTVCVKTADGAIQGAMIFRVDALSVLEGNERAVFVDRLATAPRNREGLVEMPSFRGTGIGLLTYAVAVSYSLGFSGRVNLLAIAHEGFYVGRGFLRTDIIQEGERLYEVPASTAVDLLRQRGLIND